MPMFDDPKKELDRMQKVLLEDEELNAPKQDADWFDNELADLKAWLDMDDEDTSKYQEYAKNYNKQQGKGGVRADYHDMEQEEERKTKSGTRGQQILTFLLLAGIFAVAGYWALVLL